MKILILTNSHKSNDSRVYYKIAKTLAHNNEVKIATPNVDDSIDYNDIEIIKVRSKNKFLQLKELYSITNSVKPNYIIIIEPLMFIPANIYKKFNPNVNIIYDCHEFFASGFAHRFPRGLNFLAYVFYKKIENYLIRSAKTILTVNELHHKRFSDYHNDVRIFPNYPIAIDLPLRKKVYDFIYIGGISNEKGMLKILEATKIISKERKIKVLFIGKFLNNTSKTVFQDFVKNNDLSRIVKYLPPIDHERLMIYVAKSRYGFSILDPRVKRYHKALPLKVPEYLQSGLPVLTNDFPLTRAVVDKYNCGVISEFNTHAIKKSMLKLMDLSEDKYVEMSENGLRSISEELSWNLYEDKLLDVFSTKKQMLFLSYFYPPIGGPGVQRPLKMVQEFTRNNWDIDVLSVKDIIFHSFDFDLLKEDMSRKTYRTKSLDPMSLLFHYKKLRSKNNVASTQVKAENKSIYFSLSENVKKIIRNSFIIDDKLGWVPIALIKSFSLQRKNNYDVIFATMGPYSSGVLAYLLSKIYKKKLMIDYRDHWTLNPYLELITPLHRYISKKLESKILEQASVVSVVSQTMKNDLCEEFGAHLNNKIEVTYNGYDDRDFSNKVIEKQEKRIFRYVGNFYGNRTPKYFIDALKILKKEEKIPQDVEFSFVGNYSSEHLNIMQSPEIKDLVKVKSQVTHNKAVELMLNCSVLLLFIATPKGKGVLTGKVFEYLRSGKEIFAMIPKHGEAEDLLSSLGYTNITSMEDVNAIKEALTNLFEQDCFDREISKIEHFSRDNQSKKLIKRI